MRHIRPLALAITALLCLLGTTEAAAIYDPGTGRFLQRDPIGYPDGMNSYAAYHVMWGGLDPAGLELFLLSGGGNREPEEQRRSVLADLTQQIQTICDIAQVEQSGRGLKVTVDGNLIEEASSTPKGCCCILQLAESPNRWIVIGSQMDFDRGNWPNTTSPVNPNGPNPGYVTGPGRHGAPGARTGGYVYRPPLI